MSKKTDKAYLEIKRLVEELEKLTSKPSGLLEDFDVMELQSKIDELKESLEYDEVEIEEEYEGSDVQIPIGEKIEDILEEEYFDEAGYPATWISESEKTEAPRKPFKDTAIEDAIEVLFSQEGADSSKEALYAQRDAALRIGMLDLQKFYELELDDRFPDIAEKLEDNLAEMEFMKNYRKEHYDEADLQRVEDKYRENKKTLASLSNALEKLGHLEYSKKIAKLIK